MPDPVDPELRRLRDQIAETDRALVETLNERLRLVARVKEHKARHGMAFLDPDREAWLLAYLTRANRGPLSPEGLERFLALVLELTKRELESPAPASLQKNRTPVPTAS